MKEETQLTQPLLKDWRYTSSHLKDLIISDVSQRVSTKSKLHDICRHYISISHTEPKNIHEVEIDSYWLLAM